MIEWLKDTITIIILIKTITIIILIKNIIYGKIIIEKENRKEVMDMKTYFKELVYKICASAHLQIVTWGGVI